jgi:virginiamycin A acetyltransferase
MDRVFGHGPDTGIPPYVEIEHDVWIGHNCTIMEGVKIGTGAVIGTCAVVTRDVQPYEIVGGVPAKHIKWRFPEEIRKRLLASQWWEWDLSRLGYRASFADIPRFLDFLESSIRSEEVPKLLPVIHNFSN